MFVPQGVPHAFANTTKKPAKMFFRSSILRRTDGKPDPKDIAELRHRYDIEPLTRSRAAANRRSSYSEARTIADCAAATRAIGTR
jgi:hypothetical protein